MSRLDDLIDGKFSENSSLNVRLVEIVQHHIRTLKFSALIDTVLQEVCFLEFFGTTFVICLLEYYCIVDWERNDKISLTTYSLLLISLTFNMFLLCYIGDLLIEKSTNVGICCCMIDWYRLPAKTVQDLILIIAMSSSPAKISAGKIVDLSLTSFGSVGFFLLMPHLYFAVKNLLTIAVLKGIGQFLPKIAIGLSNLVLFFTLVQCVLHIIFEQKDPLLRLKILGLTCFSFISLMKYWALTARKSKIEHCIEQLYADWKQVCLVIRKVLIVNDCEFLCIYGKFKNTKADTVEFQRDRKLMLKYGKIGRKLTVYSAVFMYSGGIIYHTIMQYAIGSYVDEFNRTIKLLVYPTYSALYDVQKSPIYELVYVLQCMCGYVFDT
ncbi:unnamed protein product, partial [Heterotrigona itama]